MQLPTSRICAPLRFKLQTLLHGDRLPYGTDSLSDKGKEQLFAVVYSGDRSTT